MTYAACIAVAACFGLAPIADAQVDISADEWRDDLRFLQRTVHQDYPFLFKKITAGQFDGEVERLHRSIPSLAEHEIVAGLTRIVSSFGYGHTALGLRGTHVRFHQLPINLYHFADGIYVEGAHRDCEQVLGAKLLMVEGMPVQEALAAVRPIVPAENDQYFKAHGLGFLGIPEVLHAQGVIDELKTEITLTLERDGRRFERTITAVEGLDVPRAFGFTEPVGGWLSVRPQTQPPHYLRHLDRIYYDEHLPDRATMYVRHSQIRDDPEEAIPAFYERVFDDVEKLNVDRFVLDLRLNGGGNNYKNKPIVTGIIGCDVINQPGKLFVIIGRRTFSACQNLVNELDTYTNAIFVGEPTAENINFYGDTRRVELPNSGIPVFLSFAWWQDKPQWENGPWTAPDLAVEMTFDDYRANRDPVLEAALTCSTDDVIVDPMAHMEQLFREGKHDELEALAERIVTDPRYRYLDMESDLNQAGYDLLQSNQIEPALFVFRLNTRLYADSANTWDSLGEALWRAGMLDDARANYRRAIELDPDGATGANARLMLRRMDDASEGH